MQLREFRVRMYKGVIDSGPIRTGPLTVLVGKNESGKTSILEALHKLNPASPKPYQIENEWPRGRRRDRRKDQVVCSGTFELDPEEAAALSQIANHDLTVNTVEITRNYGGLLEVVLPEEHFADSLHPNEIDRLCDSLPTTPKDSSTGFRDAATKCLADLRRTVGEGRYTELTEMRVRHGAELKAACSPADQPALKQEQQFLGQYDAKLQEIAQKIPSIPSMRKNAHEYLVQRLPRFIYMADYRIFQGKAILDQLKQRRDRKQLLPDDDSTLMILKLSGLDLDDLVARGGLENRDQRQFDLDDGGKTLTRVFRERLKQREYAVQFRADGQEFYTMVTDNTDVGLIKLEERSKGFQWFFSFDLLFMHESDGTFKNCVLLLDEPGLHLHPGAQRDLLARLEEYAKGNTLFYSTHLPFMLDLHQPDRIRVITETANGAAVTEDLSQSQPDAKLTLQAALGMSGSQSVIVHQWEGPVPLGG